MALAYHTANDTPASAGRIWAFFPFSIFQYLELLLYYFNQGETNVKEGVPLSKAVLVITVSPNFRALPNSSHPWSSLNPLLAARAFSHPILCLLLPPQGPLCLFHF